MTAILIAAFELLQPFLLVAAGAVATGVGTGLTDRRKRKYALQDQVSSERKQQNERKRALMLEILEHRSEYIRAQNHAPGGIREKLMNAQANAMLNTAAATGDAEVIRTVDYFLSERFDDEGELLDLVSKRVAELEAPPCGRITNPHRP